MLAITFITYHTAVAIRTELRKFSITSLINGIPVVISIQVLVVYSSPYVCWFSLYIYPSDSREVEFLLVQDAACRTALCSINFCCSAIPLLLQYPNERGKLHRDHHWGISKAAELRLQRTFYKFRKRTETFWITLGLQCWILINMGNEDIPEKARAPQVVTDAESSRRRKQDLVDRVYTNEELSDMARFSRSVNDVNPAAHDSYAELMKKYEDRFNKLKESCFKDLSSVSISNSGWETGRPKAVIADNLKGDSANIFTRPSIDALLVRNSVPESNNMATAEELARISAKVQALGAPEEHLAEVFWDVAKYCATSGSSPAVNPQGTIQLGGRTITRDMVFAVIKEYSTLRRVCRSYAPITWNNMLLTNQPPANWDAKGFTEDTKFAAFDVFDAVTNKAAIQPLEGLIRYPTQAERIAYATHKKLALEKSAQNSRFANTSAEITGGMFGCSPRHNFREF